MRRIPKPLLLTAAALILAASALLFYADSKLDIGIAIVSAVNTTNPASNLYYSRVKLVMSCDRLQTAPASRIEFILNSYYSKETDAERVIKIADHFLNIGCDIDEHNRLGLTPLHASVLFGEPEVTAYLLSRGANPSIAAIEGRQLNGDPVALYAGETPTSLGRKLLSAEYPLNPDFYAESRLQNIQKCIELIEAKIEI